MISAPKVWLISSPIANILFLLRLTAKLSVKKYIFWQKTQAVAKLSKQGKHQLNFTNFPVH